MKFRKTKIHTKTSREKRVWLIKGVRRKRQIYEMFTKAVYNHGLGFLIKEVKLFLVNGEFQKALNRFEDLVIDVIKLYDSHGEIIGYLIDENIHMFGKNAVIQDLFKNIMKPSATQKKKIPKRTKPLKQKDLKEIIKESKQLQTEFVYGIITKTNKRIKADVNIITQEWGVQVSLRNPKTGRFVKQTKSFRKQLKERQQ